MGEPVYTVFVRVPIPRNGFVDPPPVNWDSTKDAALWKILSGAAQEEIDWNEMADRFEVAVEFLLQQVAYLTERHASKVRAQVRKATAAAKGSAVPSPMPTVDAPLNRPSPAVSTSRDAPAGQVDGGYPAVPWNPQDRPNISRNTSGSTIQKEPGTASPRRRLPSLPAAPQTAPFSPVLEKHVSQSVSSTTSDALSGDSEEEDESLPAQSRIIRRPPRFQQTESEQQYGYGDDEESEPAFQPFKSTGDHNAVHDLASTLKDEGQVGARRGIKYTGKYSQISDSSGGSGVIGTAGNRHSEQSPASALSPRRKAELAGRSSSARSKGQSREGSDGTPSMGSSFSDLDDASVTQSALEEALASHLQGGASSRFSISQAFRSRYTPNSNK